MVARGIIVKISLNSVPLCIDTLLHYGQGGRASTENWRLLLLTDMLKIKPFYNSITSFEDSFLIFTNAFWMCNLLQNLITRSHADHL